MTNQRLCDQIREWQKTLAVACMRKLGICESYIRDFQASNSVYLFESFEGRRIQAGSDLAIKIEDLERERSVKVYAVTHEFTSFGECYSFLCVSKYKCEAESALQSLYDGSFYAYAYTLNKTCRHCSEFGYVIVERSLDSIRRIG